MMRRAISIVIRKIVLSAYLRVGIGTYASGGWFDARWWTTSVTQSSIANLHMNMRSLNCGCKVTRFGGCELTPAPAVRGAAGWPRGAVIAACRGNKVAPCWVLHS